MHSDHKSFERGISQSKKVRLTFLSGEPHQELTSKCGPLYYSRGRAEANESGCYYFWDFEAEGGHNFLALTPSEIVSMEPTEDSFKLGEVNGLRQEVGNMGKSRGGTHD